MLFLSHCCQSPFPRGQSQSTSPPQDALQHCAGLWPFHGSSSDSNLVLLLSVLASNGHNYQNQCLFFFFFFGGELSMSFCIFHRHRVCIVDHVDIMCSLHSWWEGFGSSSLAILSLGFNCGFISTSTCGPSTGVCS